MPTLLKWKAANRHLWRKQYAEQVNWNNQQMQAQEQITHWQVMIAWIETSDVKFPWIIEIFEAMSAWFTVVVKQIDRSFIYFNKFQD